MESFFPFGFPFPTAMYLVLYVLTLIVHVIFMNYVLAGAGYLAVSSLYRLIARPNRPESLVNDAVRDWLPAALGAAITAGVAPLLFIQILYKEHFYTANLLLLHRWMAILPVLIVGFYLLYLMKSGWAMRRPAWVRVAVSIIAFLCFAFVAWSWTENHLLALTRAEWPEFYGEQRTFYWSPQLLPRLLMWTVGSIPTFCVIMAIQLRSRFNLTPVKDAPLIEQIVREVRTLGRLAIVGLVLAALSGLWYLIAASETVQSAISEPLSMAWFILACFGVMAQFAAWLPIALTSSVADWPAKIFIAGAGVGALATILGMSIVREAIRLHSIDITRLYPQHEDAAQVGGFPVFLIFALVNIVVIAACVWIGRSAVRSRPAVEA